MLIDDEGLDVNKGGRIAKMRTILAELGVDVPRDYDFAGHRNPAARRELKELLAALNDQPLGCPDLVVIDYSLEWKNSDGTSWNGDQVALRVREVWPYVHILYVSNYLQGHEARYEKLVKLLAVPQTSYLDLFTLTDWQSAFKEHVRSACEIAESERRDAAALIDDDPEIQKALSSIKGGSTFLEPVRSIMGALRLVKPGTQNPPTVLILGASGTGKELVARAIYQLCRPSKAFVDFNAAEIPENLAESVLFGYEKSSFTGAMEGKDGYFQNADGGTLFIDEVGEFTLAIQAKLLRAIEERKVRRVGATGSKPVDVHIIAATNKDLRQAMQSGVFREDLYHRLNKFCVRLRPLRQQYEAIEELADWFRAKFCTQYNRKRNFSKSARKWMRTYPWPGNIRELRDTIERAVVYAKGVDIKQEDMELGLEPLVSDAEGTSLPPVFLAMRWGDAQREFQRQFYQAALDRNGGIITRAAEEIGIRREHFHVVVKKRGVSRN